MKKVVRKFVMIGLGFVGIQLLTAKTNDGKDKATLGIKGGFNLANFHTSDQDITDQNILAGINVGIFLYLPVTKKLIIQPEFNYTTKGSAVSYNNFIANGTAQYRLQYFEVPILLRYNLNKHVNLHAGPYAAYLLDARVVNITQNGNFDFEREINRDDLNKTDVGLAAGFGLDLGALGLGLRYNYGVSTIGKTRNYGITSYTFPNAKNSNLSLYASIKF